MIIEFSILEMLVVCCFFDVAPEEVHVFLALALRPTCPLQVVAEVVLHVVAGVEEANLLCLGGEPILLVAVDSDCLVEFLDFAAEPISVIFLWGLQSLSRSRFLR